MTYVYCVVRAGRAPAVRRAGGGLPGAGPVRAIDGGGGLWLIVADVSESEYGEAAIAKGLKDLDWVSRCAMGHEAVVERFLSAPAILPMQLFTIFRDDERARAHVAGDRRRIAGILRRVEGHVEWGVRLTWDEHAARAAVERARGPARGSRATGSEYLARKRDLLDVSRSQLSEARAQATKAHRALEKHARRAVRRAATERAAPGSRLLLDAAYLVSTSRTREFRAALRGAARTAARAGLTASLTGPWPPYNFIA